MLKTSIPQYNFIYFAENCIANGGIVKPDKARDVIQVNVMVDLRGDFAGKVFTLNLTDNSDPTRVYTSTNNSMGDLNGNYVSYMSFLFDSFHTKDLDEFIIELCINDQTGVEYGLIADWEPETNISTLTTRINSPRIEFYGR